MNPDEKQINSFFKRMNKLINEINEFYESEDIKLDVEKKFKEKKDIKDFLHDFQENMCILSDEHKNDFHKNSTRFMIFSVKSYNQFKFWIMLQLKGKFNTSNYFTNDYWKNNVGKIF